MKNKRWDLMMKMLCQNIMDLSTTITKIMKIRKKILYRKECLKKIHPTIYLSKRVKGIIAMAIFRIGQFQTIMRKTKFLRN